MVAIDHVEDVFVADLPCEVEHFVAHVDGLDVLDALSGEVDEGVFAGGFDIAVVAAVLEEVDHVDVVEFIVGVLGAVAGGALELDPEDFVVAEFLSQFLLAVFVDAPEVAEGAEGVEGFELLEVLGEEFVDVVESPDALQVGVGDGGYLHDIEIFGVSSGNGVGCASVDELTVAVLVAHQDELVVDALGGAVAEHQVDLDVDIAVAEGEEPVAEVAGGGEEGARPLGGVAVGGEGA